MRWRVVRSRERERREERVSYILMVQVATLRKIKLVGLDDTLLNDSRGKITDGKRQKDNDGVDMEEDGRS